MPNNDGGPEDPALQDMVGRSLPGGPTRELVLAKVADQFPAADREEVLALLEGYGGRPYEPETERVRLAVLKLSGGDTTQLAKWLEIAKSDFRDALAQAEYPRQIRTGVSSFYSDPEVVRAVKAEDRKEYLDWLRGRGETADAASPPTAATPGPPPPAATS